MIFRKPKPGRAAPPRTGGGIISRFRRDGNGSVAIEFGIMAIPFVMLIFAILESTLSFASQQMIANAVDRISRDVRTGRLRAAQVSGTQLADLVCARIALVVPDDCPELEVDLQQYAQFRDVPTRTPFTAGGDIDTSGFRVTPGGPSTINQMRVYYRWPVMTDFLRSYMSNLPDGKTLLGASATWRNEPFDP